MEIKAKNMCPRCKYCLGMTPQGMYSCGYADDSSELNIGVDVILSCVNFEEVNMNKVEGKVGDFCPNCKNCKSTTSQYDGENDIRIIEVECEDPYDDMVKTLDADSCICCSKFEPKPDHGRYPWGKEPCDKISLLQHELEMDRLRKEIHQLEKEKAAHMKGIERLKKSQEKLQNQVKNLQTTNEESYKREEKLEDKYHKLKRSFLEEKKRFDRLYNEFLMPLARVLYPGEKVNKPYSEILTDIKLLNKGVYDLKEDNKRLVNKNKSLEKLREANEELLEKCKGYIAENAKGFDTLISDLYKQIQDLKIDNVRLDRLYSERDGELKCLKLRNENQVTIIQGLKLQYNDLSEKLKKEQESGSNIVEENVRLEKEKAELIKASKRKDELIQNYREKLKKANELTDSWKRDYERIRVQFLCPIYNILYPDNPNLDINVTALLDDVKNLKIYAGENKSMYEDLKYWKERCHNAESDVTTLTSKVEVLNKRNTNQFVMIGDKDKEIENLKKIVERRDRWVEELKSDVDTLQNEILRIRNIAQKAYDDTNRD